MIIIRKVDLRMNEQNKYELIKKLVETNGNKKRIAIKLGCTLRHVNRMIAGYKKDGKAFFMHGNRGRKPVHALSYKDKQLIIDLYKTKYDGANFTHYSELLTKHENIKACPSVIRQLLLKEYILSPKATRKTKKKLKKHLKSLKKKTSSKKETSKLQSAILDIEDAHPRRPRCAYFGEMLQMDASPHNWFGNITSHLHIAVDDSTGNIVGGYFDVQETLKGYYSVTKQILTTYGIPYMFYTDNRTVFEYKNKNMKMLEDDHTTQFAYACKQLGIEIKTSSVPQAKGRVERMFQTLQSRVPIELKLAGITTIEAANEFLNHYIQEFNNQFALPINNNTSVFEKQPSEEEINLTLAILTNRKIDNGSCVKFKKNYYIPVNKNGYPIHYHKGTYATVIESFDGQMFTCINDEVYALDLIPRHQRFSKAFDLAETPNKPKKRYIPAKSHPWRKANFYAFIETMKHRNDDAA